MMHGFLRALRAEAYALIRRRSTWWMLGLIVFVVTAQMLLVRPSQPEEGESARAILNFWPRFAQSAGFGLIFVELCTLFLVAGRLPREINLGAAREPIVRRISRPAFIAARAVIAALLPLLGGAIAVGTAALLASLMYDAGHVVEPPFLLDPDPEGEARFATWCQENGLSPGELAAWQALSLDEGLEPAEAASRLDLPAFELPYELEVFIPTLLFAESDIRDGIVAGLIHAILPLVALGSFAFVLSVLLPNLIGAVSISLLSVLVFGVFLGREIGDAAWWVFADWLPGIGKDSQLKLARIVADGFGEPPTPEEGLRISWLASGGAAAGFILLSLFSYPRRRL